MDPINEQVSIDTAQQQQVPTVSFNTEDNQSQIPDPNTATWKSDRAAFGLYPNYTDKNAQQLFETFMGGGEYDFRKSVSSKMDAEHYWKVRDVLSEMTRQKGAPVSEGAIGGLLNTIYNTTDPDTVIEKAFADKFVSHIDKTAATNDVPAYQSDVNRDPEGVELAKKFARDVITYSHFAQQGQEEAHKNLEKQSYLGWGVDQLKYLAPTYADWKTRGMTEDVGVLGGGLGLKSNWRSQIAKAYSMPLPQFKQWYTSNLERLKKDNPSLAVDFADAVVGMSDSDEVWGNLTYTGADLAALPIGKLIRAGGRATGLLVANTAARDIARAASTGEATRVAAAAGSGDLAKASTLKAADKLLEDLKGTATGPEKKALDAFPTAYKDDRGRIMDAAGNFGQEGANRLAEETDAAGGRLLRVLKEVQKTLRVPELADALTAEAAMTALRDYTRVEYRGLKNAILNITKPDFNELLTTWDYSVHIGNYRGEYFFNIDQAKNFAKLNGIAEYKIQKQGLGYYLQIDKHLDEKAPWVTQTIGTTTASEPPTRGLNAWVNSFVGKWRTPEETLSLDQRQNRHATTYGPAVLLKWANEEIKDVKALASWTLPGTTKRSKWNQWKQIVDFAREDRDPLTGERGYFKRSPAEVEQYYQTYLHRAPDPQEVRAYFSYTRFVEMDRVLRNLNLYKAKAAWGAEQHRISLTNKNGERVFSDWFEGKVVRPRTGDVYLPKTDDRILISIGNHLGSEKVEWADKLNTSFRQQMEQGIREGKYRVLEIYDSDRQPFSSWSKKVANKPGRIRYVLTDKAETKGLSFEQVPRRGGGHFDFEAEHYIKQAQISPMRRAADTFRHLYTGDTTVFALGNRGVGLKLIPHLEAARKELLAGNIEAARVIINREMPFDFKEFHSWFLPHKGPDGVLHPPRLNKIESFQVVPKNTLIVDMDNALKYKYENTFEDGTRKGSAARQHQVQYTGERDVDVLKNVFDEGTKSNPLFKYEDAKLIDPITSINRAASRIINSTFMDDYKIFSVNHWLKEAEPHLSLDKIGQIWDSPFWYFNKAADKSWFNPDAKPEVVSQLLARRVQIQQFMGMPSATDNILHSAAQGLADTIYSKFGPTRLDPSWMIPYLSDPFRILRAVTFHAKLGFFAVPQLLVQSQTFVNIFALAGARHAGSGVVATMLHQVARMNKTPALLERLDVIASKMGWKPGELTEAMQELSKTGFEHVGGEYALRDDVMNPKLITYGAKQFLDWGTVFFKEGERNNRIGAWYTAYREYRAENPTGRITNAERQKILTRADMLTVNMSRASSSTLHQGVFSIPTQFLSYQMRLAELFMGSRISNMDRMRMAAWYGGIYGFPTAFGLSGFPVGDYIRKSAIDHGYDVGQNWITSAIMEGIPSLFGAMVTGAGDIKKGNFYNIGERYGIQGFETLREALRSDSTIWKILGGAAWSTMSNTYAQSDGFTSAMMSFLRDDDQAFPLTPDDFVDLFREISSVHNNWRMIMALNTGKWLSKKGVYLDSTSPANAIFMSLTGLQAQEVSDLNIKGELHVNQQEIEKYAQQKFTTEFRKAIRTRNEDPQLSTQYMKRALAYLNIFDYPQEKRGAAIAQASKDYESLIEQMNWNFGIKDAPDSRKDVRRETFKFQEQRRELRGM